jgi:hypothetical protein
MNYFINSIEVNETDFNDYIHELQDVYERELEVMAFELNISTQDAALILYLRSRSRWTQEKEDYLLKLAREHKKLPNVFSGEF